jgi:hypothetical protein
MSFSGSQQQQQHNHQLLQYFCLKCGILLKKTEEEQSLIDNQKNSINASNNRTMSKVWFSIII